MMINEVLATSKTSLNDLVKKSKEIQDRCSDYNITSANAYVNIRHDADSLKLIYRPDTGEIRKVGVTPHALSQLCNKIGVPARYLDKCIQSGRLDLASDNINSWLDGFQKNLLIREYEDERQGDVMRGVLSDKYSVLDTPDLLDVLGSTVKDRDYQIKGHYLSPERFHLRMVQNKPLDIEGEDLFAGLQIDSSDVGRSILTAKFFIYKQVCTNGLVVSKGGGMLFQQKHIGITREEFFKGFSHSIQSIPILMENAKTIIGDAISDNKAYNKIFRDQKEMEHLVNELKVKTKLSDEGVEKVIDNMKNVYSMSRWGLINSITQVAQEYSLERRLELEEIAGNMLMVA